MQSVSKPAGRDQFRTAKHLRGASLPFEVTGAAVPYRAACE